SCANRRTAAAPMPLLPPVTTATLPLRLSFSMSSLDRNRLVIRQASLPAKAGNPVSIQRRIEEAESQSRSHQVLDAPLARGMTIERLLSLPRKAPLEPLPALEIV